MPNDTCRAESIGFLAYQSLSSSAPAWVTGSTSRGVFLRTQTDGILFISTERYHGPLTIILAEPPGWLSKVHQEMPVLLEEGQITLEGLKTAITIPPEAVWHPPLPSGPASHADEIHPRLLAVARRVLLIKGSQGFGGLLAALLGLANPDDLPVEQASLWQKTQNVLAALPGTDVQALLLALAGFSGYGRGLTPSGDDLVMGLVLALNRWQAAFRVIFDLSAFNQQIVELVSARSTALSANLVAAAALGYADERLQEALDGIVTGSLDTAACAERLLHLGSSSGVDALVGMALAAGR